MTDFIKNYIADKGLLREVHYSVSNLSLRNHLDCNGLLTNPDILSGVSYAMINHIFTKTFSQRPVPITSDEYFLVGIANSGVLIASHIAAITGLPMMYYVPENKQERFSAQEKIWDFAQMNISNRKAILIIGMNVTGNAIENACRYIRETVGESHQKVVIDSVLGIVNRNTSCPPLESLKANGVRVNFLMEDYPVDWCQYSNSDKCPYSKRCKDRERT